MTTKLLHRKDGRGCPIIVGTWVEWQQHLPNLPDSPTNTELEAMVGREVPVLTNAGVEVTAQIEWLSPPVEHRGKRYGKAVAVPAPVPEQAGICAQCGNYNTVLIECQDSSGISGWCCWACSRGSDMERIFA